jgi:hypothetical protein
LAPGLLLHREEGVVVPAQQPEVEVTGGVEVLAIVVLGHHPLLAVAVHGDGGPQQGAERVQLRFTTPLCGLAHARAIACHVVVAWLQLPQRKGWVLLHEVGRPAAQIQRNAVLQALGERVAMERHVVGLRSRAVKALSVRCHLKHRAWSLL